MKIFPLRLISITPNFDFMSAKRTWYSLFMLLLVLSISCIFVKGFNFGIDFIGGVSMEVRTNKEPDLHKMRELLGGLNIGEVVIQNFGSSRDLSIRVGVDNKKEAAFYIDLIKENLNNNFDYEPEYRKVDFVGPQIGNQMIRDGAMALILAFAAIMCYVWIRFEWQFSLGVLVALVHDVIITLGFMSLMQYDFNLSTIAAILTIIGYSVNDSVVIYDRIRDNLRKLSRKSVDEIINNSVNETLSRTTVTVFTTLLANLALVIFGGDAIRSFSVVVFFGILVGTGTSLFISAPILTLFNLKNFKDKR